MKGMRFEIDAKAHKIQKEDKAEDDEPLVGMIEELHRKAMRGRSVHLLSVSHLHLSVAYSTPL